MFYFNLITGSITILAFGLQILGYFPKLGSFRIRIGLFSLGLFAGSLVRAFDSSKIFFEFEINVMIIVLFINILIILFLLIYAVIVNQVTAFIDPIMMSVTFFISFFLLNWLHTAWKDDKYNNNHYDYLTVSELRTLISAYRENENYDRAIMLVNVAIKSSRSDPIKYDYFKDLKKEIKNEEKKHYTRE